MIILDNHSTEMYSVLQEINISSHYRNYSASTQRSLEAWSGSQLDLGLVSKYSPHIIAVYGSFLIAFFVVLTL